MKTLPSLTTHQLAKLLSATIIGDQDVVLFGANGLADAKTGDLSFCDAERHYDAAKSTNASAILVQAPIEGVTAVQVVVKNVRLAFAALLRQFTQVPKPALGVHASAVISEDSDLGEGPAVAPFVYVAPGSKIGRNAVLHAGVVIAEDCEVGDDVVLHAHVSLRPGTRIGNRVIIHDGTVIGADGFGYVQNEGRNEKIPQLGVVVIEDDVEIGANVTIDRAAFGETRIGSNAKIDNLVQIAHNVRVGKSSVLVAQVGISGSSTIGDRCMLGGQVGVSGHISIGDDTMVGAKGGVTKSLPAGKIMAGAPAYEHAEWLKYMAIIPRLPDMRQALKKLEKKIAALEKRQKKS